MTTNQEYTPTKEVLEQLLAQQNLVASLCRCGRLGVATHADGRLRCGACGVKHEAK